MIDFRAMLPIFSSVFMAELGDKTQVATVCFVAGGLCSKWEVFLASSAALVLSTLLAVIFGGFIAKFISPQILKALAGGVFIIMGGVFLYQGLISKA